MQPKHKSQADWIRLNHMVTAAKEAISFAKGKSKKDLDKDRQLVLSLIKEVEIIGEAAAKISTEFKNKHKKIPWDILVATRHRLIHGYFDIDLDIVWRTIQEDLPNLLKELKNVSKK